VSFETLVSGCALSQIPNERSEHRDDRLRRRLEGFSGVPTSPCGGIKIRLSEIRSTAKDRVRIFPGKASVGLKKIHSAIFCYFFLKKVEGKKEK